ncbi:MAG: divalent-cation tolerance protein CutA [Parachlamydiaceae bacterium]
MTSDFIEIHWTTDTLDEARRISRYLVQERLAACAQIIPWIESVYMWNDQLETTQESKIVLKTSLKNYDKIREMIQKNSKYEIPEITWFKIEGGNQEYLEWLKESISSSASK